MVRRCCSRSLRHRIAIEAAVPNPDSGGGSSDVWANAQVIAQAWARIEPLRGREVLSAMKLEARITHRITLRYRPGVTAAMRVRFRDRHFNIRAVINPEERNESLELLCEEGVAT